MLRATALLLILGPLADVVSARQASAPAVHSFRAHDGPARAIDVTPGGWLLSTGESGEVRAWNLAAERAREPLWTDPAAGALSLEAADRGGLWASGGHVVLDGHSVASVKVWAEARQPAEGFGSGRWTGAANESATVAVCPTGDAVAIATRSWFDTDTSEARLLVWFRGDPEPRELHVQSGNPYLSLAYAPGGERIAVACHDGSLLLFDLSDPSAVPPPLRLGNHGGPTLAVAFRADGEVVASTSAHGPVVLWDPRSGLPIGEVRVRTTARADLSLRALAFAPDGKLAVAGARTSDAAPEQGFVEVWLPEALILDDCGETALAQDPAWALDTGPGAALDLVFTGAGSHLAAATSSGQVRVYDLAVASNALRVAQDAQRR